jgi:hypothetical protein
MIIKQLNRRQMRWTEMLAEYNFRIMYRFYKQKRKSNALTRRRQDLFVDVEDDQAKYQH